MAKGMITVRLPEELLKEIEQLMKSEGISRSELIREAISRHIALINFRRLRNKVLPFAEAKGLLTDEDIFRSIS